jgi:hypothetical protein
MCVKVIDLRRYILPLVQVDIGLLANQVGVTTTDTLDLGQGIHDLLLAIDVGVEKTVNCQYTGNRLLLLTREYIC